MLSDSLLNENARRKLDCFKMRKPGCECKVFKVMVVVIDWTVTSYSVRLA